MIEDGKFVNRVVCLSSEQIEAGLDGTFRQYLQGDLREPQNLPFIFNTRSEIGISYYREFAHDEPHYHDQITETNYVLEGKLCLKIVDTGEEYILKKGDVFSVPPHITHILKVQPGTRILFVKDHAVNDKKVIDLNTLGLERWLEDKEF